jgi:hypothetical protein
MAGPGLVDQPLAIAHLDKDPAIWCEVVTGGIQKALNER